MSEEIKKEASNADTDKELSELLDSALDDFKSEASKTDDSKKGKEVEATEDTEPSEEWSEELIKQAASQFETNLAAMLGNMQGEPVTDDQIEDSLRKMTEAAQQVLSNPTEIAEGNTDFAATISQTLRGLNEGRQDLQNAFSEQDLMNMFANPGAGENQNAFIPFMQGMMQSLLSKEILYPSLKDISDKFPEWLRENEPKLSPEDKERYGKQQDLIEQVCRELETETPNDPVDIKKTRFEKVLNLMQKLQDYGQPPTEVVGEEMPQMPSFNPQNPEQCQMM